MREVAVATGKQVAALDWLNPSAPAVLDGVFFADAFVFQAWRYLVVASFEPYGQPAKSHAQPAGSEEPRRDPAGHPLVSKSHSTPLAIAALVHFLHAFFRPFIKAPAVTIIPLWPHSHPTRY